jgi:hypothetical protein
MQFGWFDWIVKLKKEKLIERFGSVMDLNTNATTN